MKYSRVLLSVAFVQLMQQNGAEHGTYRAGRDLDGSCRNGKLPAARLQHDTLLLRRIAVRKADVVALRLIRDALIRRQRLAGGHVHVGDARDRTDRVRRDKAEGQCLRSLRAVNGTA